MSYDTQFDALRSQIAKDSIAARNQETAEVSRLLAVATQGKIAQAEQLNVLTTVTAACNRAWAALDQVRSEQFLPALPPPIELRETRLSIPELAAHFHKDDCQ